jgi:hypothetical protein
MMRILMVTPQLPGPGRPGTLAPTVRHMACNLPIASVPLGDVSELLAGVDGCAICPRDVGELSAGLANILRRAEPTNGRLAIERKRLDLSSIAHKVVDVYVEVLARKRECAA